MAKQKPIIQTELPRIMPQGAAQMIDSSVRVPVSAAGGNSTFRDLAKGLENLEPTINKYIQLQETQAKLNQQMGMIDQAMGKVHNAPKSIGNLGWGYEQGYSIATGEAAGIKITREYHDALAKVDYFTDIPNEDVARQKRTELLDSITKKHLGTGQPIGVLLGASERLVKSSVAEEENASTSWKNRRIANISMNAKASITDTVGELTKELAEAAISKGPVNYSRMRDMLTGHKKLLQAQGLTPHQSAGIVIEQYGNAILQKALMNDITMSDSTALLNLLKEKDSDGFSWWDYSETNGDEVVFPYQQRIESISREVKSLTMDRMQAKAANDKLLKDKVEKQIQLNIVNGIEWQSLAKNAMASDVEVDFPKWIKYSQDMSEINTPYVVEDPITVAELRARSIHDPTFGLETVLPFIGKKISNSTAQDLVRNATSMRSEVRANIGLAQTARSLDMQSKKLLEEEAKSLGEATWNDALIMGQNGQGFLQAIAYGEDKDKRPVKDIYMEKIFTSMKMGNSPSQAIQQGRLAAERYLNPMSPDGGNPEGSGVLDPVTPQNTGAPSATSGSMQNVPSPKAGKRQEVYIDPAFNQGTLPINTDVRKEALDAVKRTKAPRKPTGSGTPGSGVSPK